MKGIQIRFPKRQIEDLDKLMGSGQFETRSEAVREGVRRLLLDYRIKKAWE